MSKLNGVNHHILLLINSHFTFNTKYMNVEELLISKILIVNPNYAPI